MRVNRSILVPATLLMLMWAGAAPAAESAPRTISDITALLDQHKPDPAKVERLKVIIASQPPAGASNEALYRFYRDRANAAEELGRVHEQVADLRLALQYVPAGDVRHFSMQGDLASAEVAAGNFFNGLKLRQYLAATEKTFGNRFARFLGLSGMNSELGDLPEARAALRQAEAMVPKLQEMKGRDLIPKRIGSDLERARANLLRAEGRFAEAEVRYRKALAAYEVFMEDADAHLSRRPSEPPRERWERMRDANEQLLADVLMRQGRLAEAEIAIRNVLKRMLGRLGRYAPSTAQAATEFAQVLSEQGRFHDAEAMSRAAIDIYRGIEASPEAAGFVAARRTLGGALVAQLRWADALAAYEDLRRGLAADPRSLEQFGSGDVNWALAQVRTGRSAEAITMLEPLIARTRERLGDDSYALAEQRGFLALALAESGQRPRALVEYRNAARVLLGRQGGDEESGATARAWRLSQVLEGYIELLYQMRHEPGAGADAAAEAFRLADVARGSGAQRALSASAARAAAGTPALADLVRREQDARHQIATLRELLLRLMNASADQQLPQVISQIRSRIAELQKEQRGLSADLQRQFPAYVNLINPRPATLEETRAALREGETLVSLLASPGRTYVWVVPKQGPIVFHAADLGGKELDRIIAGVRRTLDPGEVSLERLPEFDLAGAHRLYAELLKSVEGAWKGAHTLVVVASGALGQLPLTVLPTEPVALAPSGIRFERYKEVPWLAKRVAIAQLPAVNTLVTLRALPQGNGGRGPFAGFGDPDFGSKQAAGTLRSASFEMRNLMVTRTGDGKAPVDWTPYSQLAPLPDTREEILAIAGALKADASRDVFLGAAASKQNVKASNLSTRRIVAFATHGLIPGDFPNLEEPALALSAPDGKAETGLLTLGDILGLKLDADWVVLSACNTAAGDGAGAEAISGLGRGFFYAGSRALLVTHWPVETRSARQLVTTLFERYAANPTLSRAEALRQASLVVMEDSAKDASGKPLFSYAHPLFWAPYALVGDGGR